uniref:Uncharacterized protein n=1 Tax=Timema monikensis TaxID=170555 RepID=A0A7R9HT70_9NEOP|nr:unnamed protein product [Timema monikensis]
MLYTSTDVSDMEADTDGQGTFMMVLKLERKRKFRPHKQPQSKKTITTVTNKLDALKRADNITPTPDNQNQNTDNQPQATPKIRYSTIFAMGTQNYSHITKVAKEIGEDIKITNRLKILTTNKQDYDLIQHFLKDLKQFPVTDVRQFSEKSTADNTTQTVTLLPTFQVTLAKSTDTNTIYQKLIKLTIDYARRTVESLTTHSPTYPILSPTSDPTFTNRSFHTITTLVTAERHWDNRLGFLLQFCLDSLSFHRSYLPHDSCCRDSVLPPTATSVLPGLPPYTFLLFPSACPRHRQFHGTVYTRRSSIAHRRKTLNKTSPVKQYSTQGPVSYYLDSHTQTSRRPHFAPTSSSVPTPEDLMKNELGQIHLHIHLAFKFNQSMDRHIKLKYGASSSSGPGTAVTLCRQPWPSVPKEFRKGQRTAKEDREDMCDTEYKSGVVELPPYSNDNIIKYSDVECTDSEFQSSEEDDSCEINSIENEEF